MVTELKRSHAYGVVFNLNLCTELCGSARNLQLDLHIAKTIAVFVKSIVVLLKSSIFSKVVVFLLKSWGIPSRSLLN
jgi:hypothetical protein